MKITIIGCGNMGKALSMRLSTQNEIFLYDRNREKSQLLAEKGCGISFEDINEAIASSHLIILAVKPQNLKEAVEEFAKTTSKNQTIVSLLAGTPLNILKGYFAHSPIVRMMPNLALIHGEGVIGLCSDDLNKEDRNLLSKVFEPLGMLHWLPEDKIDALTALTGSGPAFFFSMMEAMIEAGVEMGFTAKDSQSLVHQMLLGSLTVLDKTDEHLTELKWQIASPGGTTIAGLKRMEELALKGNVINTFLAAYHRAQDLSSQWDKKE